MAIPSRPDFTRNRAAFDDKLSELVAYGDLSQVRDHLDQLFWENRAERPGWQHLKIALLREDRPMLRLLATWGAQPTDTDMSQLHALVQDKYRNYVGLLRAAGLRGAATAWEELAPAAKPAANDEILYTDLSARREAPRQLDRVPEEWRKLLKAMQSGGAEEAVIAGGALRDLFNDRPIKDVDIFLRSRGGTRKNRKFLKAAFEASGLAVEPQVVSSDGYGGVSRADFPDPASEKGEVAAAGVQGKRLMESWKIIAGPGKTEYNVIFVDDALDKKLAETAPRSEQGSIFTGGLLKAFDVALCQVACDGREIVSTAEYRDDVRYRRISLLRPNATTEDHLQRMRKKYPDFQLNAEAQKALAPKPPPPRRSGYGSWY